VNVFAIDNHYHLVEIIIKKSILFVNQLPTNKNRSKLKSRMWAGSISSKQLRLSGMAGKSAMC